MNALPVGPHQVADPKMLEQYFNDVERWRFDIAYSAYYAFPYDEVKGSLKPVYSAFAAEAKRRGLPACVQIQVTACRGDKTPVSEAQYHLDNQPDMWREQRFFASLASSSWREYLKELTTFFVKECGFDWVVFEEPMYRVDIPGTKDRFYEIFQQRYPDLPYPEKHEETPSYLAVQKLKADVLVEFCEELTSHAKSVGAAMAGVMPRYFIPAVENSPQATMNTSCDIGRIGAIESLDFLVVKLHPADIFADIMRTGDDMQRSPLLHYVEVLAHALGKPLMVVNNPTDEHTNYPNSPLIPVEFFEKSTLAALAAAPNGMTRHWYLFNYGTDTEHTQFLAETNAVINRLGAPVSPVAFVFSYSGASHAEPRTYEKIWGSYWALARKRLFDQRRPMLTLYADTLLQNLASHPEVQVLIFDEHFPLTPAQAMAVRKWWLARPDRAIIVFAGGSGHSTDLEKPGEQSAAEAFPGVLEALGVREESDDPILHEDLSLNYVAKVKRSSFLGGGMNLGSVRCAPINRIFGSGSTVLYTDGDDRPVIVETRQRGSLGLFCSVELNAATAELAAKAVNYALDTVDAPAPVVVGCSEGVLWSETRGGFVVISNCSTKPGKVDIDLSNSLLWDMLEHSELSSRLCSLELRPLSFKLFRRFAKRSKLLDIQGAQWINSVIDGAGRADVSMMAGRRTAFLVKSPPREIMVDGEDSNMSLKQNGSACLVTIEECPPGKREIVLKW